MNTLSIFQVDAFATEIFAGNPAAVCPLDTWCEDRLLQAIAAENNLAETAFFGPECDGEFDYRLRWFTPVVEVELCGHATLACAHVIFTELDSSTNSVVFSSRAGKLTVSRDNGLLDMDFPAWQVENTAPPQALLDGLGQEPEAVYVDSEHPNYYVVYPDEKTVRAVNPNFGLLQELHPFGVAITAPGIQSDFASRYFAPSYGIDEDSVTGSIHSALTPYWSARLGKDSLHARQVSERGGELFCVNAGERVHIAGRAVTYLKGQITI